MISCGNPYCHVCGINTMKSNPSVVKKPQVTRRTTRPQDKSKLANGSRVKRVVATIQQGPQEALEALEKEYQTPRPALDQKHISIETERGKIYGDPEISHKAIGYVWRGILQNRFHEIIIPEIPADLVAELLAAFKLTRASRPTFHQDSFDDLRVYVSFSERFRK